MGPHLGENRPNRRENPEDLIRKTNGNPSYQAYVEILSWPHTSTIGHRLLAYATYPVVSSNEGTATRVLLITGP